jgi:hypothetical protein
MNLRKHIQKEISRILSENDNLPWGAEYMKDAPYNQEDGSIRKGETPKENKYQAVWYESNSGLAILKDASGKLYVFSTDSVDDVDYEPYADREEIYLGKDEDGMPDTELGDWSLDRDIIQKYVNDNLDSLQTGKGVSAYDDGISLVEIDEDLKLELINFATKYIKRGKEELIDALSNYSSSMNESVMSEAKMPNEPFVKVEFEYEFPSNEKRKELMDITRSHFGEPLGKSREEQYWSTYVPKLELEDFLNDAMEFNPVPTGMEIQANRFKPLTKGLNDGDIISFYDYTVSENDPPRAEGYLKPGFIQRYRSLMKWDGDAKEAWIDNSMIDKYYFYHGDLSDSKNNPGNDALLDPNNPIIIFDDDQFYGPSSKKVSKKSARFDDFKSDDENADNYEGNVGEVGYDKYREEKLRSLIKQYGGKLEFMFGKNTDKNGRWYTLIPLKKGGNKNNADDFIQAAKDFGAGYGETAGNIYLEDKALNEIRKIVRGVINKVIK